MTRLLPLCQDIFADCWRISWRQLGHMLLGWVLPNRCMACGARLPAAEPLGFCPLCYASLPWWNPALVLPPPLPKPITSFSAPFLYTGPLRQALLRFKFKDVVEFAPVLARLMLPHIPRQNGALLVAVPSHPKRLRQRLYNPSVLLAHEIAKQTGLAFHPTALKRLQHDAPQNRKTRAQRLALPGSHFKATSAVQGKTVILIDDIFTTGATTRACALALMRAGAAQVHVRTLAYTAPA